MSAIPDQNKPGAAVARTYGRQHDIPYRAGIVLQVLGAAMLAVLYLLEHPFYTAGIMVFEAGVLLSALFLLVGRPWIRKVIVGSVLLGLALQIAGCLFVQEQYAGSAIVGGIGFVCAGAAGMAGTEAFCFGYREGWLLMAAGYPIMVLGNLFSKENRIFNGTGFCLLLLLLLSLAVRKLRQPLSASSPAGRGGLPARNRR